MGKLSALILIAFFAFSCSEPKENKVPVISGEVTNGQGIKLYLYSNQENTQPIDTILIQEDGRFSVFQESIKKTGFYFVQFPNLEKVNFFLKPSYFIQLSVDAQNAKESCTSKNSKKQNALWSIEKNTRHLKSDLQATSNKFKEIIGQEGADTIYTKLKLEKDSIIKSYRKKSLEITKDIKDPVVTWFMLNQKAGNSTVFSLQDDLKLFLANDEKLMANADLKALFEGYDKKLMRAYTAIRSAQRYAKGDTLPELKARTNWNEKLDLETLNARFINVVFWDGKANEVNRNITDTKALMRKYNRRGLKTLMVACRHNKEQWNKNVQALKLPYWHLIDTLGLASSDLQELGIRSLPHHILISGDGSIIARENEASKLEKHINDFLKNY